MNFNYRIPSVIVLAAFVAIGWILFGGDSGTRCDGSSPNATACTNTAADSQIDAAGSITRIRSQNHGAPTHRSVVTRSLAGTGADVTMDVMVHEPTNSPTALVVLISGGHLRADIDETLTNVRGNFLVRSAHLFAKRGYRVVTIDRPSDWDDPDYWIDSIVNERHFWRFDGYRNHVNHCIDLSTVINDSNPEGSPVVLAGTSRGAISAFRWQKMADAISLSSSLTSGVNGTPIGSGASRPELRPEALETPACVHWHVCDACPVTTPAASQALLDDLAARGTASGGGIGGGFRGAAEDRCQALAYHGFAGIESCAVAQMAQCLDAALRPLKAFTPVFVVPYVYAGDIASGETLTVSLRDQVKQTDTLNDRLSFSLLSDHTSLGKDNTVKIDEDGMLTYVAPSVASRAIDRFVFVVSTEKGRVGHNVVSINVVPK